MYTKGKDTNKLKNFNITIDGTKLTNAQIQQFSLKWNIHYFKIVGEIVFTDSTDLVEELPIRGGNKINISLTDFDDESMNQNMIVCGVKYQRTQNNEYITTLQMIDPVTEKAMSLFPEMSWSETDMKTVIDHDETLKPFLKNKEKQFTAPDNKHENFVIPLNVSFNKVCHWLAENNNMMFFQNREKYFIEKLSKLFGESPKGDKFVYKAKNESYRRNIYDLNTKYADMLSAYALEPNTTTFSYDIENKHPQTKEEDYKGIIDKIGSTGNTPHDFSTNGSKYLYMNNAVMNDRTEYIFSKNALNNIHLEILVPGKFKNNIGDIVELDLANFFTGTEPEKNLSGNWLITEIVDILIVPEFIQRITLSRSKFTK